MLFVNRKEIFLQYPRNLLPRFVVFLGLFVFVISFSANAQCSIQNNTITLSQAVCAGTVGYLQGSTPTVTGNGTVSYQWEANPNNCTGNGNYSPISGATGKDYMVPSSADPNLCYRRVVRYGNCTDNSSGIKVDASGRTTPVAPTVTVVQPSGTQSTGTITVTNPAPAAGISYSVDGSTYVSTNIFTGLTPGAYSVTAKYPAGCVSPVRSVTISAAAPLGGNITPATATICPGGSQVLTVTGGTSYQWYLNNNAIAGATGSTYTATQAGTYSAVIFNGASSVPASNNAVVSLGSVPTGTISPSAASICTGGNQVLTVTGGTSYQWLLNNVPIAGATGNTYTATQAGTYTATISNGSCTGQASNSAVITVSSGVTGTLSPATATICSGGSQVITATGGTSYQWFRNGSQISGVTGNTYTATQAGTYSVTVINGTCSGPAANSSVITVGSGLTGSISPASATICSGSTLTLTATSNGATSYQWYRNGTLLSGATNTTYVANQAGSYSVTVSNGSCSTSIDTSVVNEDPLPTGTITPGSATICLGSSQVLSVSGGASYQWYKDGISISGATASTYSASIAGVYTADIISANGCKGKSSNSVTIAVSQLPTGSISPPSATLCSSGSITLIATGGVNYQWYKDGVAINNAFASTYTATQAGQYAVDIFDAGGCKGRSANESVVTVGSAPTGTVSPATAVICSSGSVTLTATGGTSYQWYKDGTVIGGATGATFTATQPGTYKADIFSGTCKGTTSNAGVITVGTAPSGSISPTAGSLCSGNSVALTATGGTSYQWYKDGVLINGATAAVYNATQTGTYSVTIFSGGCSGPASNTVVISSGTAITFTTTTSNPSCTVTTGSITVNGVTGGSGSGYTYSKDNGATFQTSNSFAGLAPGTYQIVVKDPAGCKSNPSPVVIATFTSTLRGTPAVTNITCTQAGAVTITASGGTSPYQYSLDGGTYQSGNSFSGLSLGAHKVTVKDAVGCLIDVDFSIAQTASTLAASSTITNASCGSGNGAVTVQATGGAAGYTYSLDNGAFQSGNSFNNLSAGAHKVTVKDAAGCTYDVTFTITQSATLPNLVITNPAKICPGTTTNLQSPLITAGSDPGLMFSYWTDATTTSPVATPTAVTEGTYYIKATNAGGCSTSKSVVIALQTVFPGSISATRTTACFSDSLRLTASGGRGYQWYRNDTLISGANSVVYEAKNSGVYSVFINDGTCLVKANNTVNIEFKGCTPIYDARALVPTAFTPNRNGANDVLRPIFYNVTTLHYFKVYNRWGQLVYETTAVGKGWDGNKEGVPQPADAYTWILECVGKNGDIIKASGRSVLIR